MENAEDMLEFIFNSRCDEIAYITEKDKEFLNSKKVNIDKEYANFKKSLEELQEAPRKEIFKKFTNYIDISDYIAGYFNEKYYKIGFSDCMKLVLNCINV